MAKLRIDVWSDFACPWCYVGKRRLEAALAQFPHRDDVEVVWHAYELDPSAPRERDRSTSYAERLATKYRSSLHGADAMIRRMTDLAREDGLDFRFDRVVQGNTLDAHRLLHLAHDRGVQDALKERFLRAYMTEGESLGDHETLVRLASEAGLDAEDVRSVLETERYIGEVRADEREAARLGIEGVPFFVLGGRYAVSGAQPAEVLVSALEKAWSEIEGQPVRLGGAEVCGPDGCRDSIH